MSNLSEAQINNILYKYSFRKNCLNQRQFFVNEIMFLNYARENKKASNTGINAYVQDFVVEGDGFEPSKSLTTDLQSAPFGHSGTPPGNIYFLTTNKIMQ